MAIILKLQKHVRISIYHQPYSTIDNSDHYFRDQIKGHMPETTMSNTCQTTIQNIMPNSMPNIITSTILNRMPYQMQSYITKCSIWINTHLRLGDPDPHSYNDKWEHRIKVRIQSVQFKFPTEPWEIHLQQSNNFRMRGIIPLESKMTSTANNLW